MNIKKTFGEKTFDLLNIIFMVLLCILMIYPMLYVISRSLMTDVERAVRPFALIPHDINFEAYKYILSGNSLLLSGFKITLFRTIVGTILSLIFESMFAYVISKKDYPYRNKLTMLMAFTMWFSGGLIPTFILLKSLGFVNSVWVYVIPKLMSVWNILILRNFFAQIPDSLEESAKIDGASEPLILFRIILPLSTAALATIGLFHMVGHWNEWFTGILYVNDKFKQPAMVILRQIISQANAMDINIDSAGSSYRPPSYAIQMATIVVVAFPIIAAYPFFQKYFTKGMLVGSVKG